MEADPALRDETRAFARKEMAGGVEALVRRNRPHDVAPVQLSSSPLHLAEKLGEESQEEEEEEGLAEVHAGVGLDDVRDLYVGLQWIHRLRGD